MLLQDKIVIVSGIGPGLGIELALRAAEQGAHLAIAARTKSKLDQAKAQIQTLGLGTEVLTVPTDICEKQQCHELVEATQKRFGHIDCLLNSAYNPGSFESIEHANLDGWREAMEVNLFGTMNLTLSLIHI